MIWLSAHAEELVLPVPVWLSASWDRSCRTCVGEAQGKFDNGRLLIASGRRGCVFCDEGGGGGNVPGLWAMVVARSVSWSDVIDGPTGPF